MKKSNFEVIFRVFASLLIVSSIAMAETDCKWEIVRRLWSSGAGTGSPGWSPALIQAGYNYKTGGVTHTIENSTLTYFYSSPITYSGMKQGDSFKDTRVPSAGPVSDGIPAYNSPGLSYTFAYGCGSGRTAVGGGCFLVDRGFRRAQDTTSLSAGIVGTLRSQGLRNNRGAKSDLVEWVCEWDGVKAASEEPPQYSGEINLHVKCCK